MSKIVFRYFFDFIDGQEQWLNSMAMRGFRLKKSGIFTYTFDECEPGMYEYAVEFVGDRSYVKACDYREYLESVGLRTFRKNINLNVSFGKVRWRPYAKGWGQIATSPGGFNRELLILEKQRDGSPFELHTDVSDKLSAYQLVRRVYLWTVLMMFALIAITFIPGAIAPSVSDTGMWIFRAALAMIGAVVVIPAVKYHMIVRHLETENQLYH